MKKLYKISDTNSLDRVDYGDYDWSQITKPSLGELAMIKKRTGLEPDTVKLILASHESNRIEGLTEDDKPLMIVAQYPTKIKSSLGNYQEFNTSPIICIQTNDTDSGDIITISNEEPSFIKSLQEDAEDLKIPLKNKKDIILLIIYYMAKDYNAILMLLNEESTKIEIALREATNNDILYNMLSIQKTISSFLDSLKDNNDICDRIINDSNYFKSEKYTQLATLASVELGEATELARHLDYLLDKYSSLISSIVQNNQSVMVNALTKWGTIFAYVSLIFGGLGINYWLPDESNKNAFIVIIALVFLSAFGISKHIDHLLEKQNKGRG